MKGFVLAEPELEFGAGQRHIDPRFGLARFGPADIDTPSAPTAIPIGCVGPRESIESLRRWLDRCRTEIPGKTSKPGQENMFPDFPGFSQETTFHSTLVFDDALTREIPDRVMRTISGDSRLAAQRAADVYADAAMSLSETGRCKVILCARPDDLDDAPAAGEPEDGDIDEDSRTSSDGDEASGAPPGDFHDLLKATSLSAACPLQIIRRETWTGKAAQGNRRPRPLQDEATRAWNLHTALYYKAGGTPWRLKRQSTDLDTCYVGISFFRTADESALHTAVAQVFNERGDGVVVRGGTASISKADRQLHLDADDATQLLLDALAEYRRMHEHQPARIVVHKTSLFDEAEITGLRRASDAKEIDHLELIWVQRKGGPRLFRYGQLPPLRGTALELQPNALVLYTRGSIPFFRTYPGMYVPSPLLLRPASPIDLRLGASEILALSKMNWNNAQLDERDPLTLRTAQRVGSILKHVPREGAIATRYAYYM